MVSVFHMFRVSFNVLFSVVDPFIPSPNSLLVNLRESKEVINTFTHVHAHLSVLISFSL